MANDLRIVDTDSFDAGAAPFRSGTCGSQFAASISDSSCLSVSVSVSAAWCSFGEASVYFRALLLPRKDARGPYGWFVIGDDNSASQYSLNTKKEEKEGKLLKPVFEEEPRPHFGPTCVVLGSFIYVLGGYVHKSIQPNNDVFYIDTTSPSDGWKEGPSLLIPRSDSSAAVMDNKIYVVDGLRPPWSFDRVAAWGEVFDPDRFEWTVFPKKMTLDTSTADLPWQQQLLLHAPRKALYTHNLQTKEWTLIDGFGGFGSGTKGVYLDGILYCADGKLGVCAYDLVDRKWLPNSVRGLEKLWPLPDEDSMYPPIYLLHIGNKRLCMIWAETPPYPIEWRLDIHCAKFNIFRKRDDKSGEQVFVAQNLTSSLYFVDAGLALDVCLAVPLQEGMTDKDVCCIKNERRG